MTRNRLPNRREQFVEALVADNREYGFVGTGFDPSTGQPREVFIDGKKPGSETAVLLADFATVISVVLQHGITASELAKSVARVPEVLDGPATAPASAIGAALDLVARYEREAA